MDRNNLLLILNKMMRVRMRMRLMMILPLELIY